MHNKEQEKAIHFGNGPLLVLAGPGSGKTYVITHRILHLISEKHIPPNQILVITFTKAAALEMQNRATNLNHNCSFVQFGTFHSVFYHILKLSNPNKTFRLVSDHERVDFLKSVIESQSKTKNEYEVMNEVEKYIKEISVLKNRMSQSVIETKETSNVVKTYRIYEEWLYENQMIDFDDMIKLCYELMMNNHQILSYWQNRFSHILIDEFQDINQLQYETIKLLCASKNLFVVGDDDQAIYSFRGAKPELMKLFLEEYKAEKVCLSVNYRSKPEIVKISGKLISNNSNRFIKKIVSKDDLHTVGDMKNIIVKTAKSREEEYELLKKTVNEYAKDHPDKTQAILTRTNGLAHAYFSINKKEHIDNRMMEDLLSYLLFINCGHKRSDFIKIMNKPVRYIPHNILMEETIDFRLLMKRLRDKPWMERRVEQLMNQFILAEKLDYSGQARYVYRAMGYGDYYKERNAGSERDLIFNKCQEQIKLCKSPSDLKQMLLKHSDIAQNTSSNTKLVEVMTFHASKGLEFDRVYLPDLEYGRVPHGRMLTLEELEEERRMFYVAITRAKESLIFLRDDSQIPSPFITELFD